MKNPRKGAGAVNNVALTFNMIDFFEHSLFYFIFPYKTS